jgi:hypothetical protein
MAGINVEPRPPQPGLYPWPFWYPFPGWLPEGSWQAGLATGLMGAAAGNIFLRGVRFLYGLGRGIEGLGIGDSDLMMMAGSFVGWQVVLTAFVAAIFPALIVGIGQLVFRGKEALPFGPSLALGVMIALLCWRWIAPIAWIYLSDAELMGGGVIVGAIMLLLISFVLRLIRGSGPPENFDDAGKVAG